MTEVLLRLIAVSIHPNESGGQAWMLLEKGMSGVHLSACLCPTSGWNLCRQLFVYLLMTEWQDVMKAEQQCRFCLAFSFICKIQYIWKGCSLSLEIYHFFKLFKWTNGPFCKWTHEADVSEGYLSSSAVAGWRCSAKLWSTDTIKEILQSRPKL